MHNFQTEKESILQYLIQLKENNNRDWFKDNKEDFDEAMEDFQKIVLAISEAIRDFDPSLKTDFVKNYVFRIYRDVRFSKDKQPYKTHFGAFIANGGRKAIGGGYYMHFEPSGTFVGGGVYAPQKEVLQAIRNEIYFNYNEFKAIVEEASFLKYFGKLEGSKLKNGPKDFPKDHEAMEYLKHKDFVAVWNVNEEAFYNEGFLDSMLDAFKAMKPLNDFLNRAIQMSEE